MNNQFDKKGGNKKKRAASSLPDPEELKKSATQLKDNREETSQLKASTQNGALTDNRALIQRQVNAATQPVQLKTHVINKEQSYDYDYGSVDVGKQMESWLDPADPIVGQSANLNKAQDNMMSAIRSYWSITGGDVVKGHLLNDNLGGKALNNNLYPITRGANKDHLMYAENKVKTYVWNNKNPVYYAVRVNGTPNIHNARADFEILVKAWNKTPGDRSGKVLDHITIPSDLNSVRDTGMAFHTDNPSKDIYSQSNPKKPGYIKAPYKTVGSLPQHMKDERAMDMDDD